MKSTVIIISGILLTASLHAETMDVKQEGIKYIKMLGGALKSELQRKIKADKSGVEAVRFCQTHAGEITKAVNAKLPAYARVRRTALKLRNAEENHADAIDVKVMQAYVAAIQAKTFSPKDIKVVKDGDVTRIYKPLLAKPVCLVCHGSKVSKAIQREIAKAYPNDKAINFKEDTLRGVIVAEIQR